MKKKKTTTKKKYTAKRPLTVWVNRARHLRGDTAGGSDSMMRNEHGGQCCLGFVGRELGCSTKELHERSGPSDVVADVGLDYDANRATQVFEVTNAVEARKAEVKELFRSVGLVDTRGHHTATCKELIAVNDGNKLRGETRETKLKSLGLKIGINFKFFG
jgi:hypothetical protein